MAKRFYNPQQHGDRKKPRLDVSRSDHNFPLSQNAGFDKEPEQGNTWGDENDDEILLLASQACEQAYSNDISTLPDYSMCMQPGTTSTQLDLGPSSSKSNFVFKKPGASLANIVSNNVDNKFNRISSPLPGMSNKYSNGQLHDNVLMFNDKIIKNQDPEHVYKQLLQLQEENAKLKSENGKLQEKCVTKEGEASILRTQLKTCQVAVDNARLDKIKAQEKVQMEWTEKLVAANNQARDLKTQLDFKNLEIISIKERCKMLESSKVKLTQVTLAPNDFANSRLNSSIHIQNESSTRRVKVTSSSAQTNKTVLIKLTKTCRMKNSNLKDILPIVLEPSHESTSVLDTNEKLQRKADFAQNKCRIFGTLQRVPVNDRMEGSCKLSVGCVHEDVTCIATSQSGCKDRFLNLLNQVQASLDWVVSQLESISQRTTSAFLREMDDRYIEATCKYTVVGRMDLIGGKILFKEEQAIIPRRLIAILGFIVESSDLYVKTILGCDKTEICDIRVIETIARICSLLDSTSCTIIYSGLLQSITVLLEVITKFTTTLNNEIIEISKSIITSRPVSSVSVCLVRVLRNISNSERVMEKMCVNSSTGNLKVDYDQGVLLYKKETCHMQILLKQIEAALKCIERAALTQQAVLITEDLISFYANVSTVTSSQKARCDCQLVMSQVIVYALQICAVALRTASETEAPHTTRHRLTAICRSGVALLYRWSLLDAEPRSAGRRQLLLETLRHVLRDADAHGNMLAELLATLQPPLEGVELPSDIHQKVWTESFSRFTLTD